MPHTSHATRLLLALLIGTTSTAALAQRAYVTNSNGNSISVVDLTTSPPAVVGQPIATPDDPHKIVASPDGNFLYFTHFADGETGLTLADLRTAPPKVGATLTYDQAVDPFTIALSTDGGRLYVPLDTGLAIVNTAARPLAIIATAAIGASNAVVLSPDGTRAYVTQRTAKTVTVVDLTANPPVAIGSPIAIGTDPYGAALNANGSKLYVANQTDETISVIDTTTSPVAVTATLSVGAAVTLLEMGGDDHTLFAPTGGAFLAIDTSTTPPGVVTIEDDTGSREPQGISMAPGGATVYAINYGDNTVGIIDTASKSVRSMLTVGANPLGLALGGVPTPLTPAPVPTVDSNSLALLGVLLALSAAMALRELRRRTP